MSVIMQDQEPVKLRDQLITLALSAGNQPAVVPSNVYHFSHRFQIPSGFQSTNKADKSKFQLNFDVKHFSSDELSVKVTDDIVVIEGHHDEKQDQHGWVARQFLRRVALPQGYDVTSVQATLSTNGVLTITAPLEPTQAANERDVPIIQTGLIKKTQEMAKDDEEAAEVPAAAAKDGEKTG